MSNNTEQNNDGNEKPSKFNYYWIYAVILISIAALYIFPMRTNMEKITEQQFFREYLPSGKVSKIIMVDKEYVEVYLKENTPANTTANNENSFVSKQNSPKYYFDIASAETFLPAMENAQRNASTDHLVGVSYETRGGWKQILNLILPFLLIIGLWIFIMRRINGGMGAGGGQIFNIGKSKATLFEGQSIAITFDDVAGLDEAKAEVREVVDFLKEPGKYTALGGKIPKGVLLVGPPGTGKTLLARAMAGEAKVPFFSISGSDFVELFVGVGASRVRDLFKQAREKAPCVIFIDEIDAIGRARGKSMLQGNDERENTLNALLVEMDGFASDKAVIMLAATNRPDVLDSALMRPGRFDRQISIDRPDAVGREQIFRVHLKPIKIVENLDVKRIAVQTPGFAGADIANVCNEAALIAARKGKSAVDMSDFQDAIDRVIGGLEKKNKIILPEEKNIIAYHEAGHAIAGWYLRHAHPLLKVTIIPRGVAALGYAQYVPNEQYLYTTEQLVDQMCMTLGGRVAEDIVFGRISTGAQNDLERITKMAHAMVSIYGMTTTVGNVSYYDPQNEYGFQKPYSEATAQLIDGEVRKIIDQAYHRTKQLLTEKRHELEILAKALLKKEVIHKDDLEELIGKRPFDDDYTPPAPADNSAAAVVQDELAKD